MKFLTWRIACAAAFCGAGFSWGGDAAAQSLGGSVPNLAPSAEFQTMQGSVPVFAPAVQNAAADPMATGGSSTAGNNIFNNPLAAPLLYNSMLGTSMAASQSGTTSSRPAGLGTTQLAMMMLLANQQNGGMGSGLMGGSRGSARQKGATETQSAANAKSRSTNRPGGLASRYFNRTGGRSSYPRNYYNRRPSYFP